MTAIIYLSQNLRWLRKQRKCTQAVVAAATGLRRTTLANYETGTSHPDFENLVALCRYYNVSIDTMLTQPLSGSPYETYWMNGDECASVVGMLETMLTDVQAIKAKLHTNATTSV